MKQYVLDCRYMTDKATAHRYIARAMNFPEYYGNNLDALEECLREMRPPKIRLLNTFSLRALGDYGEELLKTIRFCCSHVVEEPYAPVYRRDLFVTPGMCGFDARMHWVKAFTLFMDLATEHAWALGLSSGDMSKQAGKDLFWLTVRTKVVYHRRPDMMEQVTAVTWPRIPGKARSERCYSVEQNGAPLISGKTEWAVMDVATGRPQPLTNLFPDTLALVDDDNIPTPFSRFPAPDENSKELCVYTVPSGDIDLGHHMNNVAYVRAALNAFSNEQIEAMDIREIEVCFRRQCYEGQRLHILDLPCDEPNSHILALTDDELATCAYVRLN